MPKDNPEQPGATPGPVEGAPKKEAPAKTKKPKGERPAPEGAAPAAGAAPQGAPPAEAKPKEKARPARKAGEGEQGPHKKSRGRSMRGHSRRHEAAQQKVDRNKQYEVDEGIRLLKDITRGTKFVQTINLVMNLGIDPKNAEQMIRGAVSLPKGIGKAKRVIAFRKS